MASPSRRHFLHDGVMVVSVGLLSSCGWRLTTAPSSRIPRIAFFSGSGSAFAEAFRSGLSERGWADGQNPMIETGLLTKAVTPPPKH